MSTTPHAWVCRLGGSDRGSARRVSSRARVATPLSWAVRPTDRKLCVPAFRRVCRVSLNPDSRPSAFPNHLRNRPKNRDCFTFWPIRQAGPPRPRGHDVRLAVQGRMHVPRARFSETGEASNWSESRVASRSGPWSGSWWRPT